MIDQDIDSGTTAGIVHKVKDKISIWIDEGNEVQVLSLYSFKLFDHKLELINDNYAFEINKHNKITTLFRLMYSSLLLLKNLNKFNFDLIYMRTRLYMPFIGMALRPYKVIMELNTDDVEEWRCTNKIVSLYNLFTRAWFYKLAIGYVSVSRELTSRYTNFNKKTITIANGIKVSNYPFIEETSNERPRICFVGSPGFPWFGLEKIEFLATKLPECDFVMIGMDGDNKNNIEYLGFLQLEDVKKIIGTCDVALSSMSLYVKSMEEASALKSRQYLAHGVPFVYSYIDTDLQGDEDFGLVIPNTPSNVKDSVEEIREFINKCFKNREIRLNARQFAEQNLDVNVKEKKRLNYLKNFI